MGTPTVCTIITKGLGLEARYMFKYISGSVAQQCFDQTSHSIIIEMYNQDPGGQHNRVVKRAMLVVAQPWVKTPYPQITVWPKTNHFTESSLSLFVKWGQSFTQLLMKFKQGDSCKAFSPVPGRVNK